MARKRVSVPPVAQPPRRSTPSPWESTYLPTPSRPSRPSTPPRPESLESKRSAAARKGVQARRRRELDEIEEIKDLARQGDDVELLPYQPTPSINPPRPRTLAAGYSAAARTLFVRFRDGTPWEYYDVGPNEWRNFRRVKSPGRYINRVLNAKPYARGDW